MKPADIGLHDRTWRGLWVCCLWVLWMGGAQAQEPDDPSLPGAYAVGYRLTEATDNSRDRETGGRTLPLHLWYPASSTEGFSPATYPVSDFLQLPALLAYREAPLLGDRRWPLLVFSHEFDGTPTQSTPLMETLASHGFVVVAVDHIGNSQSPSPLPKDAAEAAADRVPDISFAIDTLLQRAQDPLSLWYRAVDPFRIGVTGHSFGGAAAMGIAVGEFGGGAADPRVRAIMPVAGVLDVFSDGALSQVPVPLLLLGGSLDTTVPIASNARAFDLNQALEPAWSIAVEGATHGHFANVCAVADGLFALGLELGDWAGVGAAGLVEPWLQTCTADGFPIAEAQRLQNLYTVAFFKLHLVEDGRYMRFLTPSYRELNEPAIALERKALADWVAEYKVW